MGVRTEAETAIYAVCPAIGPGALTVGADETDRRPVGQVPTHTGHGELAFLGPVRGSVDVHVQQAHVGRRTHLARDPKAAFDGQASTVRCDPDSAAVEHLGRPRNADLEQAGVLEEERSRLGKEKAEAAEVDLLSI